MSRKSHTCLASIRSRWWTRHSVNSINEVSSNAVLSAVVLGNTTVAQNFAPAGIPRRVGATPVRGASRRGLRVGLRLLGNVRLRVEVLDTDGTAVAEAFGWVFGDLTPGGREYFVVPAQRVRAAHRVSVRSFDVSGGGV